MTQLIARRYDTLQTVSLNTITGTVEPIEHENCNALPYVAPGLCDLQVNGYAHVGFNNADLTTEGIVSVVHTLRKLGVTRFFPTCTTDSVHRLEHSFELLSKVRQQDATMQWCLPGFHLEGPFISPTTGARGAHPLEHVRQPNYDLFQRLQQAANGNIRLVTLAPELEGAIELIEKLVSQNIVVAIGHTEANQTQIQAAVAAGASMSTHLGNGCPTIMHRHANVLWEQLSEDRLTASLIVDGHHLPPIVVKAMLRCKTPDRTILVSDATHLAGCQPGLYHTPLGSVELLECGKLVIAGQRELLAGAAVPLGVCLGKVMQFTDCSLTTAINMASQNPARLLHLPVSQFPHLHDWVVFNMVENDFQVVQAGVLPC